MTDNFPAHKRLRDCLRDHLQSFVGDDNNLVLGTRLEALKLDVEFSQLQSLAEEMADAIRQAIIQRGGISDPKVFEGSFCIVEPLLKALTKYKQIIGDK